LLFYLDVVWFGRWPEPWNFKNDNFRIIYSFPSHISALFLLHTKTDDAILLTTKEETGTFQSALLFTSTISDPSYVTGRAGVWEADDIVKFDIALLDFFPATLFWFPQRTHYFWRVFRFLFMEQKQDYSVTSVKDVEVCF
jgi:hypothetical protein